MDTCLGFNDDKDIIWVEVDGDIYGLEPFNNWRQLSGEDGTPIGDFLDIETYNTGEIVVGDLVFEVLGDDVYCNRTLVGYH